MSKKRKNKCFFFEVIARSHWFLEVALRNFLQCHAWRPNSMPKSAGGPGRHQTKPHDHSRSTNSAQRQFCPTIKLMKTSRCMSAFINQGGYQNVAKKTKKKEQQHALVNDPVKDQHVTVTYLTKGNKRRRHLSQGISLLQDNDHFLGWDSYPQTQHPPETRCGYCRGGLDNHTRGCVHCLEELSLRQDRKTAIWQQRELNPRPDDYKSFLLSLKSKIC